jgi:ketosteroid isomerase-like protein
VRHSYRLGLRWLARGPVAGWPHARQGLYRLLVPLEPWRYFELGTMCEQPWSGRVLDVGSPKLLPSLLRHEGRGAWAAVDLHAAEVEIWRHLDPLLELHVEDARALTFPDASFDAAACVSMIEHVPGDGDAAAMAELYTTDGVIFPERSEAITGRAAIRRYWTLPAGRRVTRHVITPVHIRVDGRHAYDHGTFEIAGVRDGKSWGPFRGKYVVVWRREPAGWRIHLDMWNSGPEPPS